VLLPLTDHQAEYKYRGFTVLDIIPEDLALSWGVAIASAIDAGRGKHVDGDKHPDGVGSGRLFYDVIDGNVCEEVAPSMLAVYRSLPALWSAITGLDVVCSPHPRSKVDGTRYPAGGGQQGWHFDQNGVTVLMYLTTNPDGGATWIQPLDGGLEVRVFPKAGSILLMQGRKVWHCGGPTAGTAKVISPWNYYVKGDTHRPDGVDDEIYGRSEK
jgi:hypothetical protein